MRTETQANGIVIRRDWDGISVLFQDGFRKPLEILISIDNNVLKREMVNPKAKCVWQCPPSEFDAARCDICVYDGDALLVYLSAENPGPFTRRITEVVE